MLFLSFVACPKFSQNCSLEVFWQKIGEFGNDGYF